MFGDGDDLLPPNDAVDNECGNECFLLTLDECFDTVTDTLGSGNAPAGAGNDDEHDGGDDDLSLKSNDET